MFTQNLDHSICNSIISNTQKTETAQMSVILQCTGITVVIIVQSRGNTGKHWLGYFKLVNFMVCNLYLDVKEETKSSGNVDMTEPHFPAILASGPALPGLEWSEPPGGAEQHCSIIQHSFSSKEYPPWGTNPSCSGQRIWPGCWSPSCHKEP